MGFLMFCCREEEEDRQREMQSQVVCRGCASVLLYPSGATNVCCALCSSVTSIPSPGYNQAAHVNCGNCRTALTYPNGSPSVKCPVCHYVTNVSMANMRIPLPANRPNGIGGTAPSTSVPLPHSQTQTVVVENPMSVDESGKLVSNVVVGVTTEKK
ncbi:protein LSD1-like isoform X4 [Populus nigra]|uniref:protein LSD1-like isoform X4 n=1 Tax=Populus nigra TaxID=3691 RepID=UPI002B273072|nr:protein LSD1-like isoform X4 [Populus nigra]